MNANQSFFSSNAARALAAKRPTDNQNSNLTARAALFAALLSLPLAACSGGSGSDGTSRTAPHLLSAGAVIVDNGQPGTASTGTWTRSTASGFFGTDARITSTAGATFSWTATLAAGRYEVLAWYSARSGRSRFTRYAVAGQAVTVNQRLNGGQWNLLGTFNLSGTSTVTLTATESTYTTCADAIAWNPATLTPPGTEIVIDDGEQGTSKFGTWSKSGGANPYGVQSLYANKAGAWYSWEREIAEPGSYQVFVWWTSWNSRERSVPYEVATAAGPALVTCDQFTGGGQWQPLGTFAFSGKVKVTVRCPGTKTVAADAVRFVPSAAAEPVDVTVEWDAPTLNADGTACADLAGFKVAFGSSLDSLTPYEDVGLSTSTTLEGLGPGDYTVCAKAYDDDGNESARSDLEITVP